MRKSNRDIIEELQRAYEVELPDEDVESVDAYHLRSTNSIVSANAGKDTRDMVKALEYFEKAERTLRRSHNPNDTEKADYCNIASKVIRQKLVEKTIKTV